MIDERLRWHRDPEFFRAALTYTAAETAFVPRLIEKDYFCTVLLQALGEAGGELVFRGGTCLTKVHAGFYRLSEDLDFLVSMPTDARRRERSRRAEPLRRFFAALGERLEAFELVEPFTGANDSAQYAAIVGYASLLGEAREPIKIEVSFREPVLRPVQRGELRTLLLDPTSGEPLVPPLAVSCLSRQEAMAEKLRAALTRREVAIRDYFDIDYAVHRLGLRVDDPELLDLLRAKLAVPGNAASDRSEERRAALRRQAETQLRPVLRPADYEAFDLERAIATVLSAAVRVA